MNGKQPIRPLGMKCHVGTKAGQESKRDRSQIVGTVLPKSGRLATMHIKEAAGRTDGQQSYRHHQLQSGTLNSELC